MRFSVWPNPTQPLAEMLEIARHAEATGWDGLWLADHFMPDRHCEDVGRDPASIQRSAVALLFLSDDAKFVEGMRNRDIGRPKIVGDVDEVREIVQAYRDAGVDELIVPDFTLGPMPQKLATLDRFIGEVAGPLR